jgi:predicted DCC family thiol-disulfide oxidoreductase YuxK
LNHLPILVFDGDCGFCRFWVTRVQRRTGDRVEYVPYQSPDVAGRAPHLSREHFVRAVHLIEPDGQTSSGALAVFRLLAMTDELPTALNRTGSALTRIYQSVPGAAAVSEAGYRFVANHRRLFTRLTALLSGQRMRS